MANSSTEYCCKYEVRIVGHENEHQEKGQKYCRPIHNCSKYTRKCGYRGSKIRRFENLPTCEQPRLLQLILGCTSPAASSAPSAGLALPTSCQSQTDAAI